MPEREYFSLRWAIPGYTFILLIILINSVPLLETLKTTGGPEVFGVFLALLSLLSGSAIGFLVSQFWWWWFVKYHGIYMKCRIGNVLRDRYGLDLSPENESITHVFNYISYSDKRDGLLTSAQRIWDMYHLLSSTIFTLLIGWTFGILFRFCYWVSRPNAFSIYCNAGVWIEVLAQISIFVVVILLAKFIQESRNRVFNELCTIAVARVRTSCVKPEEIRKAFREFFPKKNNTEN